MGKQRTLRQYRAVDLSLFGLMLLLFESVIIQASTRWFPAQPWTVSLTPAVTAVVMFRWGPWCALHAALGGLVLCAEQGAAFPSQYAVYMAGNLLSLAVWLFLRRPGRKALVSSTAFNTLAFGLAVLLFMQAGRAAVSLCFGWAPAKAAGFFTTEAVTDLFTLVILWIVRRLDGVLEDQRHYLLRVQEEMRNS